MSFTNQSPSPGDLDRRRLPDRRRRPTPIFGAFASPGRRRGFRRAGEGLGSYVDIPSPRTCVWVLGIILLSILDALLTLLHIRAGGSELIPTMRFALLHGETTFLVIKMAATAIGAIALALHENFTIARLGFRSILALYVVLMGYHLILAFQR